MEQGSLRADANVSVRRVGAELGTRCEIKNLNSIRFLRRAIEIEAARQIAILEDGGTIRQETRLFDPDRDETRSMRSKEEAHDYRYFPDPDLLPLVLSEERVARLAADMPELPDARKQRYVDELGLRPDKATVLIAAPDRVALFDQLEPGRNAPQVEKWVNGPVAQAANVASVAISSLNFEPEDLGNLIDLEFEAVVSARSAKEVFGHMLITGYAPSVIIEQMGLEQVSDRGAIEAEIDKVLAANPDQVAQFKAGKEKVLGFFVGQVMKATKGKANPGTVNEILRRKLS